MFYTTGLFVLTLTAAQGFILEKVGDRNVTKILQVKNGGRYGYWTTPEFCPRGTFASGFSMKIEGPQFAGDDTTLNSIRLTCSDSVGHTQSGNQITSGQGPFGSWTKTESCNQQYHSSNYLVAYALQVEAPQGSGDDTSADYVKFHCRDFEGSGVETELSLPPGSGSYGSWGEWSDSCDQGSAICGLNTKIEDVQGSGDDTALNDVIFYCCSDTENGQPFGK